MLALPVLTDDDQAASSAYPEATAAAKGVNQMSIDEEEQSQLMMAVSADAFVAASASQDTIPMSQPRCDIGDDISDDFDRTQSDTFVTGIQPVEPKHGLAAGTEDLTARLESMSTAQLRSLVEGKARPQNQLAARLESMTAAQLQLLVEGKARLEENPLAVTEQLKAAAAASESLPILQSQWSPVPQLALVPQPSPLLSLEPSPAQLEAQTEQPVLQTGQPAEASLSVQAAGPLTGLPASTEGALMDHGPSWSAIASLSGRTVFDSVKAQSAEQSALGVASPVAN